MFYLLKKFHSEKFEELNSYKYEKTRKRELRSLKKTTYKISKTNAIPKEELRRQSVLCTRIVLNIPLNMKGKKLKKFIEEQNRDYGNLYNY